MHRLLNYFEIFFEEVSFFPLGIAYLLGSIPFGMILMRLFGHGDLRLKGSGNIGATNVLRTGNKMLAFLTLVLDMLKGYVAVKIAHTTPHLGAFVVILGHVFPFWLKFKGGKGVAPLLGALFSLSFPYGSFMLCFWLICSKLFKISSLSSLLSLLLTTFLSIVMWWYDNSLLLEKSSDMFLFMLSSLALIIWTHRGNITRLMKGKESCIKINL